MDNAILNVVLSLVLIYLVLALLAVQVQAVLDDNWMRGRVNNLNQLVFQAVGRSADLKDRVLANPLIAATYRKGAILGDKAEKRTFARSTGPAAIAPELFARVLLIELNGGSHPERDFTTPSAFVNANVPDPKVAQPVIGKAQPGRPPAVWGTLAGLLAGREASWSEFEASIARWFEDVGDRSEGWFKRRQQWWSLWVAFGLAALLNVDSFYIAKTLSRDKQTRDSLADIAMRVDEQRRSADAAAAAATVKAAPVAERPAVQAAASLTDAIARLSDAARRDRGFGSFSAQSPPDTLGLQMQKTCPMKEKEKSKDEKKPTELLVGPVTTLAWLYILPALRTSVEMARIQDANEARTTYQDAFNCLAHLSSWLTTASGLVTDQNTARLVQDAAVAIESAKTALVALRDQQATPSSLRQRFLVAGDEFDGCASSASRAEFDACLDRAMSQTVRLPLLFVDSTWRPQFCVVRELKEGRPQPGTGKWPCAFPVFDANPKLGIGTLYLEPAADAFSLLLRWLAGVGVTTLFVALGAPFWFDVLSRVVKIKVSGSVREQAEADKRGRGTLPPAPPAGAPAAATRINPPGPGDGPFAGSRNAFEDGLVARDIVALQQALPQKVTPTGVLDVPTRNAIAAFVQGKGRPATEELTRELFYEITGRDALRVPAAPPSARLVLGRVSDQAQPVAARLMGALGFPGRIAATADSFTFDLRALVVLYRYKRDAKPVTQRDVFELAAKQPSLLDEADEALIDEILKLPAGKTFAREAAAWLDWAIGETGQVERDATTRLNSNERICQYLDSAQAGAGAGGDHTAWCGAFVAWVLKKHIETLPAGHSDQTALKPVGGPLTASNWVGWGQRARSPGSGAAALQGAVAGDVVVFNPLVAGGSSGHVAFFIQHDPVARRVWALGGNQSNGSRVSLTSFNDTDVRTVRFK